MSTHSMPHTTLKEVFEACSENIENFRIRPGQNEMADAVFENFQKDGTLLVEAETGIGKTFAYLIPAILTGKTVVVSTATRALQDQLVEKDLPLLVKTLKQNIVFTSLKGVSNYVCKRKFYRAQNDSGLPLHMQPGVDLWLKKTTTGEHKELPKFLMPKLGNITTTTEHRLGKQCPHFQNCFVTKSRRHAQRAAIVVVNHHLLSQDLRIKASTGRQAILPKADLLIVDEAHRFVDVFSSQLGFCIERDALAAAQDAFYETLESRKVIQHISLNFHRAILSWEFFISRLETSLKHSSFHEDIKFCEPLTDENYSNWLEWDNDMDTLIAELHEFQPSSTEPLSTLQITSELKALRNRVCLMAELESPQDNVYWASFDKNMTLKKIESRPLGVSEQFRTHVMESDYSSVLLTSATLQTNQSFDHIQSQLGLEDANAIAIANQFDYTTNSILYIPRDLPSFEDELYTEKLFKRIIELLTITDGRAFVLFTSHRVLKMASFALKHLKWPMVFQGQSTKNECLSEFKNKEKAVLCGTGTFWEGIDIPGEKLSQVIIDRLPFQSPSDPHCAAIMEKLEKEHVDPFKNHQLPHAILALRQGIGRLLRREDDRGILSILDNRLVTKSYGKQFLSALPPFARTSALKRIETWWSQPSVISKAGQQPLDAAPLKPDKKTPANPTIIGA